MKRLKLKWKVVEGELRARWKAPKKRKKTKKQKNAKKPHAE